MIGLEYSAATEQSNVSARGSAVARFRFGKEGEESGEQAVRCDPLAFADSSWETPRSYRLDENSVDQSPAGNQQTQTTTPSRPVNTDYFICYYVVADPCGRAI